MLTNASILTPRPLQVKANVTSIRSKVDQSISLSMNTPPLSTMDRAKFMEIQGIPVLVTLAPQDQPDIPPEKIDGEISTKTQAQRIRGVIFILWEQTQKQSGEPFEDFYRQQTEQFIDSIKEKFV